MNIKEEIRINGHQPVVGCKGSELGNIFENWIQKFGTHNTPFMLSLAYSLGRTHGVRAERTKRKRGTV